MSTFTSTLIETDNSYRQYNGPKMDTASIILIVLLMLSCFLCCFVKGCGDGNTKEYTQTSQQDIDDITNQPKNENTKQSCNCKMLYYVTSSVPPLLMFGLGLNLLLRYGAGQCSYYEDAKCGSNNTRTASSTYEGKQCSEECALLYGWGIALLCIGGIISFALIGGHLWESRNRRTQSDKRKQMKIGCDCC